MKMKAEKKNSSRLSASDKEVERDEALISRIREVADSFGSVNALAKAAGVSQSGLQRYLNGGEPSRRAIIAIAKAGGVSIGWLAAGIGEKELEQAGSEKASGLGAPDIDLDALEEVIAKARRTFAQRNIQFKPEAEARIIRLVYEYYIRQGGAMDEASLDNVIELAAFR